jgi:hypothetical protein
VYSEAKMLRKFLFLDDSSVWDYLSVLEGYVTDDEVGRTEKGQIQAGASIDLHLVGAEAGKRKESEDQRRLIITPPARFERLHKLLAETDQIQQLDAFDQEIWDQIGSGEMLEILADIRFPDLFSTLLTLPEAAETLDSISSLLEVLETFGPLFASDDEPGLGLDSKTREQLRGFEAISGAVSELANQPAANVPIVFEAINTQGFQFFARLPRQHMRVDDLRDLEGQAYVFGKVFRKVRKGQDLEVFSLVPGLTSIASPLNRHQRRAMKKASSGTTSDPTNKITDKIKGPAIVLDPVAIYR